VAPTLRIFSSSLGTAEWEVAVLLVDSVDLVAAHPVDSVVVEEWEAEPVGLAEAGVDSEEVKVAEDKVAEVNVGDVVVAN
jgi:hypothetical protein